MYYQRIWNPELAEVAEVAVAVLEDDNTHDRYAVAKVRDLSLSIFDFLIMRHIAQFSDTYFLIVRHSEKI